MKVVVIGCGASGISAAISIKRKNKDCDVIIFEKEDKPLKKVLKTGNGRCNYYNSNQNLENYHSSNNDLISNIINEKNLKQLLSFYDSIGIVPKIKNGYYYPYSNQSSSVVNLLLSEAKNLGIKIEVNSNVTSIEKDNNKFIIKYNGKNLKADKVVVSTGSYSSFQNIDKVNSYDLLRRVGHSTTKILPSLVQLRTKGNYLKKWSGVRCNAKVSIFIDNRLTRQEEGEIQLTDYGISGICIFNISGIASLNLYQKKKCTVEIDFLKDIENISDFFESRSNSLGNRNCRDFLEGIFNTRLIDVLLDNANVSKEKVYKKLNDEERENLFKTIKRFSVEVIGTNDFSRSQVSLGGVRLDEIDSKTMESKIIDNLYITGEVLDVDGCCGGYNLTFAFLTGLIVGRGISNDKS